LRNDPYRRVEAVDQASLTDAGLERFLADATKAADHAS
jgi:hypothetical protein